MSIRKITLVAAGLAMTIMGLVADAQAAGRFGGGSAGCYYNCPPPPPPPPSNGNAKHSSTNG